MEAKRNGTLLKAVLHPREDQIRYNGSSTIEIEIQNPGIYVECQKEWWDGEFKSRFPGENALIEEKLEKEYLLESLKEDLKRYMEENERLRAELAALKGEPEEE